MIDVFAYYLYNARSSLAKGVNHFFDLLQLPLLMVKKSSILMWEARLSEARVKGNLFQSCNRKIGQGKSI